MVISDKHLCVWIYSVEFLRSTVSLFSLRFTPASTVHEPGRRTYGGPLEYLRSKGHKTRFLEVLHPRPTFVRGTLFRPRTKQKHQKRFSRPSLSRQEFSCRSGTSPTKVTPVRTYETHLPSVPPVSPFPGPQGQTPDHRLITQRDRVSTYTHSVHLTNRGPRPGTPVPTRRPWTVGFSHGLSGGSRDTVSTSIGTGTQTLNPKTHRSVWKPSGGEFKIG